MKAPSLKTYEEFIDAFEKDTESDKRYYYAQYQFAMKERERLREKTKKQRLKKREAIPPDQRRRPGRPKKVIEEVQEEAQTQTEPQPEAHLEPIPEVEEEEEVKPEVKVQKVKRPSLISMESILQLRAEVPAMEQMKVYPHIISSTKK